MGLAAEFARERGAGHLWLEVTNINASAIHAHWRMGLAFCGLDTILYDSTPLGGRAGALYELSCP